MIARQLLQTVLTRLDQFPAVALLGPRQTGKTTLAQAIAAERENVFIDLETQAGLNSLAEPVLYLSTCEDKLVILDEVQRMPELFQELRGIIDHGRRQGRPAGHFLILGPASMNLLKQSGESLAGRIAYTELAPFNALEVKPGDQERLWLRGGFPNSYLADSDTTSSTWRENFIRAYVEWHIPQLGPRIPAETLRRFWTMLARAQGQLLNATQLARGLGIDSKTVARYLDLLVDLLLVRRLQPWRDNTTKRLVKSPKTYVRDSGLVHTLLGLNDREALLSHPIVADSWEGFVIENILRVASERTRASFYRTSAGAEVDLVLEMPKRGLWAIEIKHGLAPKPERGFHHACEDLNPTRRFVVYSGAERYPVARDIEVIGLEALCREVSAF